MKQSIQILVWAGVWSLACLSWAAPSLPASVFFVPNLGQWDGAFLFYYENGTLSGYVTTDGLTLDLHEPLKPPRRDADDLPPRSRGGLRGGGISDDTPIIRKGHVLMLDIVGGKQDYIEGTELLSSYSNYFLSRDSCRWRGHVPNYQSLLAREVWPGIDIEYRATLNGIETVFHVQPGADPSVIQMRYRGTDAPLSVDANGSLRLVTSMGTIFEQAPFAFQIIDHGQQSVPVAYHLLDDHTYNLTLGSYDRNRELVVDPLVYCTLFPAYCDHVVLDREENFVIAGGTRSPYFPTTPGAYQDTSIFSTSVYQGYISKLNRDATEFLYSTYFAAASGLLGEQTVDIDSSNRIYFFCESAPTRHWPLTMDAYDSVCTDGSDFGFAVLSEDGASLIYSTYLGGPGGQHIPCIKLDCTGRVYLFGTTHSQDLPTTPNAWFPTCPNGGVPFIAIFDPTIPQIVKCTYLTGNYCAASGRLTTIIAPGIFWYIALPRTDGLPTTPDALVPDFPGARVGYFARVNLNTQQYEYGSYLGVAHGFYILDLEVIDSNRVLLAGSAGVGDLEMPPGGFMERLPSDTAFPGFILELELPNSIVRGTYLGENYIDYIEDLFLEADSTILVAGQTYSEHFPTTPDAYDRIGHCNPSEMNPPSDLFLARLTRNLDRLVYGTYFGSVAGNEFPVQGSAVFAATPDRVWLIGGTNAGDGIFPITPDAFYPSNGPGFLARFDLPLPQDTSDATDSFIPQPSSFSLSCYPNPFNPSTKISFTIPKSGAVSLRVFDVLGREVALLLDRRIDEGEHSVLFGRDGLASGVYFLRLQQFENCIMRKVVMIK